jgi:hypothetical protein
MLPWFALVGCASDPGGPGADPIPTALAPCGFLDGVAGRIDVSERADIFHDGPFSRIEASLLEYPMPEFHEVFLEAGGCRYFRYAPGSCAPACTNGEVCSAAGECLGFPGTRGGGLLTVEGLGDPIAIEAESFSTGTYVGPTDLPGALFAAGDAVGARLAGDEIPALTLGAEGVALLDDALLDTGFGLVDGADADFTWAAGPDPDACVELVLNGLNVSHGGPLQDIVVCEGTDTGSLAVPQAMVEAFPAGETPEFTEGYDWPHSQLTRFTRAVDAGQGIELRVRSTVSFLLEHTP